MTLQQIADYAMEYLDSKGVAAEYFIRAGILNVTNENGYVLFLPDCDEDYVKEMVDKHLI